jgi:hypothetical protein
MENGAIPQHQKVKIIRLNTVILTCSATATINASVNVQEDAGSQTSKKRQKQ